MARTADSIFGAKNEGLRIQGIITRQGGIYFEATRGRLARLFELIVGRKPKHVSDSDVVEYLVRGEESTIQVLRGIKQ